MLLKDIFQCHRRRRSNKVPLFFGKDFKSIAVYVPYKDRFEIWVELEDRCVKTEAFASRKAFEDLQRLEKGEYGELRIR